MTKKKTAFISGLPSSSAECADVTAVCAGGSRVSLEEEPVALTTLNGPVLKV